jgi:Ca-activated chloride channel family protein
MTLQKSKMPLLAIVFVAIGAAAFAQKLLRVDIDLVLINVTVTDKDNHPVMNLEPENFQIFEDRIEQKIQYFSSEAAPVSLGIVFDVSHSMTKKITFARDAAVKFLQTGMPEDEYFLVEFSNRAKVAQGFTADINRLRDKIVFSPADGATALYDAVYLGLAQLKKGRNPRKALLLITDGEDNHSRYSRGEIRDVVREADAQIFVIDLGRALLGELADMTGGHSYRTSVDDLEDTCEKIARELKSQYVIGYESTNTNKDGKFRRVRVRAITPPSLGKVNVRARDGYYARGASSGS